jgi:GTP-binding protein
VTPPSIRNIAIIAHVDHGKTTLVDAMLRQTGTFQAHEAVQDRAMDSMDQERERGITILAKSASVTWQGTKINIVDTPGHADFGGEVERGLTMVDGCLLLVDASEGPLPQTRFVLRKALAHHLPIVLVINKIDRADARVADVVDEVYALFMDLDADEHQIEFPIVYTNAREGTATLDLDQPGTDLVPLFHQVVATIPPPEADADAPLQALVANLDASQFVGRLALCRVRNGNIAKGESIAWCKAGGGVQRVRVTELYLSEGMERVSADSAGAGDIVAVAGIEDINIGDTLADPEHPNPLPPITVDEPSIGMTIGANAGPLAGKSGSKLTARMIKNRLDAELIGNVSLRVLDTDSPDAWEVQGRGEMQLAVLIESMRREGFELVVGKPQVLLKTVDGDLQEPIERVTIDVPEEHVGAITQLISERLGRMEDMVNHGTGWVRIEYLVPARGLIGFRTRFLTDTRGTGIIHHNFECYDSWRGAIRTRGTGSIVADRPGPTTGYAIGKLEDRGSLFVAPGEDVYEGMIVGENSRAEDMNVNVVREKKLTNMRSSTSDVLVTLTPPRKLSLEEALEFIREDECVEVTPDVIRLRKVELSASRRQSSDAKARARAGQV